MAFSAEVRNSGSRMAIRWLTTLFFNVSKSCSSVCVFTASRMSNVADGLGDSLLVEMAAGRMAWVTGRLVGLPPITTLAYVSFSIAGVGL